MNEVFHKNGPRISPYLLFFLLASALLLCYSPALFTKYAFSDDYANLERVQKLKFFGYLKHEIKVHLAHVRFFLSILKATFFSIARDIQSLAILRFFSILGIALIAWFFHLTMRSMGWPVRESLPLAYLICVMPPFQVYVGWATLCSLPIAALMAVLAAWKAKRFAESSGSLEDLKSKWKSALWAVLLLFFSLNLYQPLAMFYWVIVAVQLFSRESKAAVLYKRFILYGLISVASLLLSLAVFQITSALNPIQLRRTLIVEEYWEKLQWFFTGPLAGSFSLVFLREMPVWPYAAMILTLLGLFLRVQGKLAERGAKVALAIFILPLVFLPNLLTIVNATCQRTMASLTALVVFYCFLAIQGYAKGLSASRKIPRTFGHGILLILALCSGLMASRNVNSGFAYPQHLELSLLRSKLVEADWTQARSIYFIPPASSDSVAPFVYSDEFGSVSLSKKWVMRPAIFLLLKEVNPQKANIFVRTADPGEPHNPPKRAVVIDMRELKRFLWRPQGVPPEGYPR